MICPKCKSKLYLEVVIKLPTDYSEISDISKLVLVPNVILTNILKTSNSVDYVIERLKCWQCGIFFDLKDFGKALVQSQITGEFIKVENACIVSEKAPDNEILDNKIKLLRPPKLIAKNELAQYSSIYNPNEDNLVIETISTLSISALF